MTSFAVNIMSAQEVDNYIDKVLKTTQQCPGKLIDITENEALSLCHTVQQVFLEELVYLECNAPIHVCGDIHGQFPDLIRVFELVGYPSETNSFLFLGDYVDRGKQSIETITLLFAYKIKYSKKVFILRGNHECYRIAFQYGFFDECKRRFQNCKVFKTFCDIFEVLPVAAFIEDEVFCCHGGIPNNIFTSEFFPEENLPNEDANTSNEEKKKESNNASSLLQLFKAKINNCITRPCDVDPDKMICDILWADPMDTEDEEAYYKDTQARKADKTVLERGWVPNHLRLVSYLFTTEVIHRFLDKLGLSLMVRAHQVAQDGYFMKANGRFVTIFTAPNYCKIFDNAGAVLNINKCVSLNDKMELWQHLEGSFTLLKPLNIKSD